MKNFVHSFLKLFYNGLIHKGMYAIHSGDASGAFFVYIKEENRGNSYALLLLPNTEAKYVQQKEIKFDLKHNNVIFVKKLPTEVYEVCRANFIYYAKKEGIYASR